MRIAIGVDASLYANPPLAGGRVFDAAGEIQKWIDMRIAIGVDASLYANPPLAVGRVFDAAGEIQR